MKTLFIVCFFFGANVSAQVDTLQNQAVQVSFIYPLGTNGIHSSKVSNNFSLNVLAGWNGGVNGMEIGGIANMNTGAVNGWQIGGIANINKEHTNGVIIGGIANIIGDSAIGCFVAGISNVVAGNTSGMYVAGISNSNAGRLIGSQIAGISNFSSGDVYGTQISGISNVSLGDLRGVQIGLVNMAKKTTGVQLGLINISNEYEKGIPIGLLSFVKKGYHAIEISSSDAIPLLIGCKIGVRRFYNSYEFGVLMSNKKLGFTMGMGVGTNFALSDKWALSIELSNHQVVKNFNDNGLEFLTQGGLLAQFNLGRMALFAGPSINLLTEAFESSSARQIHIPYTIYEHEWKYYDGKSSWWIGANAGVTFAF